MKNRCVYTYVRNKESADGTIEKVPYYVGKGTIRRAYDWRRHNNVKCPPDSSNIHIVAQGMTDTDAMQLEVLLIHLYGRRDHHKNPGPLHNRTCGGDGPASMDDQLISVAESKDKQFWEHNSGFFLTRHPDGYFYSPTYPRIQGTRGDWLTKSKDRTAPKRTKRVPRHIRELDKHRAKVQKEALRLEVAHYETYGSFRCPTFYQGICKCVPRVNVTN